MTYSITTECHFWDTYLGWGTLLPFLLFWTDHQFLCSFFVLFDLGCWFRQL